MKTMNWLKKQNILKFLMWMWLVVHKYSVFPFYFIFNKWTFFFGSSTFQSLCNRFPHWGLENLMYKSKIWDIEMGFGVLVGQATTCDVVLLKYGVQFLHKLLHFYECVFYASGCERDIMSQRDYWKKGLHVLFANLFFFIWMNFGTIFFATCFNKCL